MTVRFHADDFGITVDQAHSILDLSTSCGGEGALSSISIFSNSPFFAESAALAKPFVHEGCLQIAVHINLVEGPPVSAPEDIPLLVNERGMFAHDFIGLMRLTQSRFRGDAYCQIRRECAAQIRRFLEVLPDERAGLNLDSHQHVHMITPVFRALLDAAQDDCGCIVSRLRFPVERVDAHLAAEGPACLLSANLAKNALLSRYASRDRELLPHGCRVDAFSGIMLSGHMQDEAYSVIKMLERRAQAGGKCLEVLFHPVSVAPGDCLDPENVPFAMACSSPNRDAEAARLRELR